MRYIFLILLFPIFLNFQSAKSDVLLEKFKNKSVLIGIGVTALFVGAVYYFRNDEVKKPKNRKKTIKENLEQVLQEERVEKLNRFEKLLEDMKELGERQVEFKELFEKTESTVQYFVPLGQKGENLTILIPLYELGGKNNCAGEKYFVMGQDVFQEVKKKSSETAGDKINFENVAYFKVNGQTNRIYDSTKKQFIEKDHYIYNNENYYKYKGSNTVLEPVFVINAQINLIL